jgi:CHAT domain-containing protein
VFFFCVLSEGAGCRDSYNTFPEPEYRSAWLKLKRGELNAALAEADEALGRLPSSQNDWRSRFTVLKAETFARQRRTDDALVLLTPELPPSLSKTDTAVWRKLAQCYASALAGQMKEAQNFLEEAEALAKDQQPGLLGEVALRRGTMTFLRGDASGAGIAFREALRIAQTRQDLFLEANALGSLGLTATKQEHYDESIGWFDSALRLSQSIGARSAVAKTFGNLGWSSFEMGDIENARALFSQAEEESSKLGLLGDRVYWLNNIGSVYFAQRDYASAEATWRKALGLSRDINDQAGIAECFENLALLELRRGKFSQARQDLEEVDPFLKTSENHFWAVNSYLIAGRLEEAEHNYALAEQLLRRVISDPAAETSLRWEAEARVAKLLDEEGLLKAAEGEYKRSIETIETARSSVNREEFRLTFLSSGIEFYDDYVDFLISHGRSNDALKVAELSRARTLADGLASSIEAASVSARELHPQEIARKLGVSLLFYWIGEKSSYLWVISPAKTTWFKLPKASDIEPLVKTYRKKVLDIHDAQDAGSSEGKQLYSMLVEPAKKLIPAGSRVIVLPSESLYGLNFETLIVPEPQPHFWIEDVTLTTGNSLSLLASSATRAAPKEKSLFLVGDTESPGPAFPPLPQVREEMKLVEKYFLQSQTKILEGKQATPTAYLGSNPERFSYVHFVTHGTASQTRPLESAVILSKEGDSYKLYARDIVKHHLNASLVTISACNGSGTRAYSGEGLVGLSWAFLRAGAHNVIGALWEVSEASTPQLMDAFYGELFQDKDPATALRDAKLKLLHSPDADSVFRKPFYWAPFQLYAGS